MTVLTSLLSYDELRAHGTKDVGNLITLLEPRGDSKNKTVGEGLCHLAGIFPFTTGDYTPYQNVFTDAAAVALAAHHLNVGDGSIVPEVENLDQRCPIRFTTEFADTEYKGGVALNHAALMMNRKQREQRPCAVIGAHRSSVSIPLSIYTGFRNLVQVSATSTSVDLDDSSQYPLFARTIPSDHGNSIPIMMYFSGILKVKYLSVINVNDAYGNAFVDGLRKAANQIDPGINIHQIPVDDGAVNFTDVVSSLKSVKYRFIFAIIFSRKTHNALLKEAYKQGVAGNGKHNWFFADSFADTLEGQTFEYDSSLHLAYRGIATIQTVGGVKGRGTYDKFVSEMETLRNPDDIQYLGSILPKYDNPNYDNNFTFMYNESLFSSLNIDPPLHYEAVIALGLSACNATGKKESFNMNGTTHFQSLVQTTFQGISGRVIIDSKTGTRDPKSALYTVTNYQEDIQNDGNVIFKPVMTDLFLGGKWEEQEDYIFNDNTAILPSDIPLPNMDVKTLKPLVRGIAGTLSVVTLISAFYFIWWTKHNSLMPVVKSSQPFFLIMLCIGVIILISSIIPIIIDHDGMTTIESTIICNSIPWLVVIGISVILSALSTKAYRVNKIWRSAKRLQHIKVALTKKDIAVPMVLLLSANIIILSAMVTIAPSQWGIIVQSEDDFGRPNKKYAQCSHTDQTPYFIAMGILNATLLIVAIIEAYQARSLSTEFSETQYILMALVSVLLVLFVGSSILFIARDNPDAIVLVGSAIIFVTCSCFLLLIFVPKMHYLKVYRKDKREGKLRRRSSFYSENDGLSTHFSSETDGMKMVTIQPAHVLAEENELLKKRLSLSQKENRGLKNGKGEVEIDKESKKLNSSCLDDTHSSFETSGIKIVTKQPAHVLEEENESLKKKLLLAQAHNRVLENEKTEVKMDKESRKLKNRCLNDTSKAFKVPLSHSIYQGNY